jgi:DHA1 family bicyclomycin/chloramphenicol resistance-like MFS transporter
MKQSASVATAVAVPSIFILAFMASLGPFGDTEYTPSLPAIAHGLGISYGQAQLSMSVYLAGFALSQILWGPLSDRFGRRPMILIAIATFLGGSLICAFSTDLTMLLLGRLVQSLGASAGGTISNAAIRDSFPEEQRTRVFLQVNTIFALAPGVGPIAGSLIDHYFGWQYNFYLLAVLAILLLAALFLRFPETNRHLNPDAAKPRVFIKTYLSLLGKPVYLYYVLVLGLGFGLTYASLVEAPHLVITELGYPSKMFAVVAFCIVAAFIIGASLATVLSRSLSDPSLILAGLAIMLTGSLAIGVFDEFDLVNLTTMLGSISVIYVGIAFVVPVATARAVAPFETIVGSASSLMGGLSMGLASLATLFVAALPGRSAEVMFIAFSSISALGVLVTLVVFIFWRKAL